MKWIGMLSEKALLPVIPDSSEMFSGPGAIVEHGGSWSHAVSNDFSGVRNQTR